MEKVTANTAEEETRQNFFVRAAKKLNEKRQKIALALTTAYVMSIATTATAFAEAAGGGDEGDAMFTQMIEFFAKWIGRIGLVVGFIGAVMFGLAIKNEDADAKTRGLMTMASGFVVFAITKALDMFNIT